MPEETKKRIALEIAHVLFIDIIGYSKLSTKEQRAAVDELTGIVRATQPFREAEVADKLIRIPTGDGMALVFYTSPDAPAECAIEIDRALKGHARLRLRMGVHSGPVSSVTDVNERANVAGAGINMAQRVMDCGDAGHILVSKHVAEDLDDSEEWRPCLHDLGTCEVKHGIRVSIVNLYGDEFGNPRPPRKFMVAQRRRAKIRWAALAIGIGLLAAIVTAAVIFSRSASRFISEIPRKSIAVLPFENLSSDKENAYFADGVQDEILTNLAKIADLKVISRTSVMQYKTGVPRNLVEIGKQLGVAHLLEGSVQRSGGQVRVNAQLIDARSDAHLWAENYDRPLGDVFAIQSEIAKTIADQLKAKLSPSEKAAIDKPDTTDMAAYDLYLRAKSLFADSSNPISAKANLMQAARFLDEAVARDPRFLVAWCLLSRVHGNIHWDGFDHTPARLEMANAAVQNAVRLQPDSGEAHLALADYYYHGFRDYDRARTELATARRTLPNSAEVFEYTAYIDRRQGRWEDGTRNLERALALDPRNFFTLQQLAQFYRWQRRYQDEAQTYDRALKIVPGDPQTRMLRASVALDWQADIKPYQNTLATLLAEDPKVAPDVDDPFYSLCERTAAAAARVLANYPRDGVVNHGANFPSSYWEGVVARWQNDSAKAKAAFIAARAEVGAIVEKQPDFAAALSLLGMIDAGLGRKEDALREGRRACELMPTSKDAFDGAFFAANLAQIYAWVGEKKLATEQLAEAERGPTELSYGFLKLQPQWDSLRTDSEFAKIVASLAPKRRD
jgi:TolB-like protein/class 3 adenylate cyclase/Flp pilus assembly protein TadD